jgi:SagB-type dehydrogenase family enzyme
MNAQDIDIYVVLKDGAFVYTAKHHELELVASGDFRSLVAERQENVAEAPVICVLVSDISRFNSGDISQKLSWAAIDAGTVSQNIALFCASLDFATRPRATMNKEKLKEILKLNDTQYLILNNPVSYKLEKK